MAKPGPRTTYRYSREFKSTAVRLSQIPGVAVGDVAESLYIHPFMLSLWRKQAREGLIMTKGVAVDKEVVAELQARTARTGSGSVPTCRLNCGSYHPGVIGLAHRRSTTRLLNRQDVRR